MSWRAVLDGVDAVESWIAGQSYWVQVPVLLAVLIPVVWAVAGVIDRIVERILWPHTRREMRLAAVAAIAHHGISTDPVMPAPWVKHLSMQRRAHDEPSSTRSQPSVDDHRPAGHAGGRPGVLDLALITLALHPARG